MPEHAARRNEPVPDGFSWRGQDRTAVPRGEAVPRVRSRPSLLGPGYSGRLSSTLVQRCAVTLWVHGGMGQEARSTGLEIVVCLSAETSFLK